MYSEVVGDLTKPSRMLTKAMNDDDGTSRVARGEFGVIEANVGEGRVDVLLGDGILVPIELTQELLLPHSQHKDITI